MAAANTGTECLAAVAPNRLKLIAANPGTECLAAIAPKLSKLAPVAPNLRKLIDATDDAVTPILRKMTVHTEATDAAQAAFVDVIEGFYLNLIKKLCEPLVIAEEVNRHAKEKDEVIQRLHKEKNDAIERLQMEKDEAIARLQKEKDEVIQRLLKENDELIVSMNAEFPASKRGRAL